MQEAERLVLSAIEKADGVLDLSIPLNESLLPHLRSTSAESMVPYDEKLLSVLLLNLETQRRLKRRMISTKSWTGQPQHKSILTLPGLDTAKSCKVSEIRDELRRGVTGFRADVDSHPNPEDFQTPYPSVDFTKPPGPQDSVSRVPGVSSAATSLPRAATPSSIIVPEVHQRDLIPTKRIRVTFTAEEDKIMLRAVPLMRKYVDPIKPPWHMLKSVIPHRQEGAVKRRFQSLERTKQSTITEFLGMFESRYSEAQRRGEVKPIESGPGFDLGYYLNWWDSQSFDASEQGTSELLG
jgi:hypothetical protein